MFELGFLGGMLIGIIAGLMLSFWFGYWKVKQKLATIALTAQEAALNIAKTEAKAAGMKVVEKFRRR